MVGKLGKSLDKQSSVDPQGSQPSGASFPVLLPFQILHYPIPQLMKEVAPPQPDEWRPTMNPQVREWKEKTDHLQKSGNQLYLHVPFCPFFCHFCPLYKTKEPGHKSAELRERFVEALLWEIESYGRMPVATETVFDTVYFGGGTPTELSPEQLRRIMAAVSANFRLAEGVEVTLEGVASHLLDPNIIRQHAASGFTRISCGVQSLNPTVRKLAGRGEPVESYAALVEAVRQSGTGMALNLDLMAGLPEQTAESFLDDVRQVIEWDIGSVDVYSYWMVPGTRTYDSVREGSRNAPNYNEILLEMRRGALRLFNDAGYHSVSGEAHVRSDPNRFIRTTFGGGGNACNVALGLGPSAIGFLEGTMYRNISDLEVYLDDIGSGRLPVHQQERLDLPTAQRRALLFGFQRLFLHEELLMNGQQRRLCESWVREGLLEAVEGGYALTDEGIVWYNQMQLSTVPFFDMVKMAGILGSATDQIQTLSSSGDAELDRSLQALIRGSEGAWGSLRLAGYKGLLRLKRLPMFDGRAMGFAGPVTPPVSRSRW